MNIDAHIIMFNEADILPLVIKHYKRFCRSITFYDNYSTDSSQLIAESMGCDVKRFGQKGILDDLEYLKVKNNCWKGSDADFVIVCDADEVLLIKESELEFLSWEKINRGCNMAHTMGWQIQSNDFPKENLLDITNGWYFENYSKSVMFDPKAFTEINYKPGAHICNPIGDIVPTSKIYALLHYKNIGGVDRLIKRNREYAKRMSYSNRVKGYGIHYLDGETKTRREWAERIAKSKPLL